MTKFHIQLVLHKWLYYDWKFVQHAYLHKINIFIMKNIK